jgi:Na+-translocating ferredoxin:NAD+ oxidoreductase RnfA subunit
MFIFNRPFGAVAAGIGFALAMVLIAALCERAPGEDGAPQALQTPTTAVQKPVTCALPEACGMVRAGS